MLIISYLNTENKNSTTVLNSQSPAISVQKTGGVNELGLTPSFLVRFVLARTYALTRYSSFFVYLPRTAVASSPTTSIYLPFSSNFRQFPGASIARPCLGSVPSHPPYGSRSLCQDITRRYPSPLC